MSKRLELYVKAYMNSDMDPRYHNHTRAQRAPQSALEAFQSRWEVQWGRELAGWTTATKLSWESESAHACTDLAWAAWSNPRLSRNQSRRWSRPRK